MYKLLKYKIGRVIQKPLDHFFYIPFGSKSEVFVKSPPGNVFNLAKDYYSIPDLNLLLNNINEGETFFDVGANYGYFSLAIHDKCNGNVSVHCFEPEDEAFFRLLANKIKNNAAWTCIKMGVGNKRDWLKITTGQGGYNHIAAGNDTGIPCPVITLDEYISEQKIEKIDLMKIDVEGFEMNVLRGGEKSFTDKKIKKVLLELDGHQKRYGEEYESFSEFFISKGYVKTETTGEVNFEFWTAE